MAMRKTCVKIARDEACALTFLLILYDTGDTKHGWTYNAVLQGLAEKDGISAHVPIL